MHDDGSIGQQAWFANTCWMMLTELRSSQPSNSPQSAGPRQKDEFVKVKFDDDPEIGLLDDRCVAFDVLAT